MILPCGLALFCALVGCAVAAANGQSAPSSSGSALVPGGAFVQGGRASETRTLSLGLQWNRSRSWRVGDQGRLPGYQEVAHGWWRVDNGAGATVSQIGIMPVLPYRPGGATQGWFLEGGVGVNWLAPVYRTHEKSYSTVFNFGDSSTSPKPV